MNVHIQSRDGAQLRSAALLAAFDDLMVTPSRPATPSTPGLRMGSTRPSPSRPGPTGRARGVRSAGKRTE
jgi:hypothetical protein